MNREQKLFSNKFIKTLDQTDNTQERKKEFKKYYEQKKKEQQQKQIINKTAQIKSNTDIINPDITENSDIYSEISNFKNRQFVKLSTDNEFQPGQNDYKSKIKIEKNTIVSIDTKDRDTDKFPKQNNFKAFLGKTFLNVKKIELVSTEFPNTDQVIKELPVELQNNLITWQNEEDSDLNFFTGLVINTIVSDSVDITLQDHGYTIGSTLNVNFYNSKLNTETDPSGLIDGKKQISVLDKDTFRFSFTGGISGQGTTSIDLGYPIYQVFIKPGNYTASTLAAQIEADLRTVKRRNGNGQFHYFEVNVNLDTDVMTLDSVIETQLPNNSISSIAGSTTITVNQSGHGFKTGDRVKMLGLKTFAGIDASVLNGDFIINVVDFNTFTYEIIIRATETTEGGGNTIRTGKDAPFRILFDTTNTRIQFNTGFPNEDSSEYIGVENPITTKALNVSNVEIISNSKLRITTILDHELRSARIRDIISIQAGSPPIITTSTPHDIDLPQIVTLRSTNTTPLLNGSFFCVPTGIFTFTVRGATIAGSGNTGQILYGNDKIRIFNLRSVPNILLDPVFYVENIPLPNQFDITFRTESITQSSITDTIIGTSQITINHPNHGFNSLTSITGLGTEFAILKTFLKTNLVGTRNTGVVIEAGPPDTNTVDLTILNHGLSTSDEITIINSNTDPVVDGNYKIQVIDLDIIRINFIFSTFVDGTGTVLTGDKITINNTTSSPRIDGTYFIDNRKIISNISLGTISSTVTTTTDHNFSIGDIITISESNSTPDINGEHTIQNVVNSTSFEINLEEDVVNIGTFGIAVNNTRVVVNTGFEIISSGINPAGILGRSFDIDHYRVQAPVEGSNNIAGISLRVINNLKRPVEKIIDQDNYMIITVEQYANENLTGGGSNVRVSSEKHGLRAIQANTNTGEQTGDLFRSISLEGENYVYMAAESEGVQLNTVLNTANIPNTFAKILLSESPGNLMFNSFVSEAKVFDNPIASLNNMKFQILTPDGFSFNFNDIDYSFTLRITELVDQLENSFVSSRTGTTEYSNLIGSGSGRPGSKGIDGSTAGSSTEITKSASNFQPVRAKSGLN